VNRAGQVVADTPPVTTTFDRNIGYYDAMALRYSIVASSSSGNAVWVSAGDTEVLLDCGIGERALAPALGQLGTAVRNIHAVVCTHHHGDHSAGIPALARAGVDVHAAAPTFHRIRGRIARERQHIIHCGRPIDIGSLRVRAVPTSHDAPGSVALVVSDGVSALGLATDLGRTTRRLVRAFSGLDAVILESNHDVDMLLHGPYPAGVKRRIRGPLGHLSNAEAAEFLASIAHIGLRHVTLAHLSAENNTAEHAMKAVAPVMRLCARNAQLTVADHGGAPNRPTVLCGAGPLFAALA